MSPVKNKICPYCQTNIKDGAEYTICAECGTPHHRECWNENRGCTTFGCKENPDIKKESNEVINIGNKTVEEIERLIHQARERRIPVSNPLTNCPECNSLVDENSRYCKFCGHNFNENQTPIKRNDFEKEYIRRYKQRVSLQRKGGWTTLVSAVLIVTILILSGYFAYIKINEFMSSPKEEIRSTVVSWKRAWESKNIEEYKSYLADNYQYTSIEGDKKEEKRLGREERIERIEWTFNRYDYIKISFSDMKIDLDTSNNSKALVTVQEKYESDKYGDEGKKELYLERDSEGKWKIYKEIFEL
ncbi:MAG: hypothetical protein KDC73_05855 [Ignavibacteriae bacterium]|nr:hypothetical protein [Ignavibacteriota bacterium]MCB9243749.1 hypothetical protein [Ignavibacteriales bacterium]